MISFTTVLLCILLSFSGLSCGIFVSKIFGLSYELASSGTRWILIGILPVTGSLIGAILTPNSFLQKEIWALTGIYIGFSILGYSKDKWKVRWILILPYGIVLSMIGVFFGLRVEHSNIVIDIFLSTVWPLLVISGAKLASVVDEMPFLLFLESGLTFLLFFPTQFSTPYWAIILALNLTLSSAIFFTIFLTLEKGKKPGNSIIFPLAYLLAAISILGKSQTLLFFCILIPSMVTIYPVLLICLIIMSSFLGNELYQNDPKLRSSPYSWSLKRERIIVFTGWVFLLLNFGILLTLSIPSWKAILALSVIFTAMLASFLRAFGSRKTEENKPDCKTVEMLGLKIHRLSRQETLKEISKTIKENNFEKSFSHVITADSLAIMRAKKDRKFNEIFQRASIVTPDGAGIVWAADFLGTPLIERVSGISLVDDICEQAAKEAWPVFFLGSAPGRAEDAAIKLNSRFPGLIVAGCHHGFFSEGSEIEDDLLRRLGELKPKILFVAMGVPRQEYFISRARMLLSGVIAIGIGGSLDVISGALPRAPLWMQKFAMEWLFRLYKEPKRFRRMMGIPAFVLLILRAKMLDSPNLP
ncbi:MAG: WecB/TagA/CpsF family glycosyltransferase [Candidatus Riflebacteria bacterium]|nr:WecB/TagA/CpsF family glycosyltransferase [Candidatus Riflebacteria bacterium]